MSDSEYDSGIDAFQALLNLYTRHVREIGEMSIVLEIIIDSYSYLNPFYPTFISAYRMDLDTKNPQTKNEQISLAYQYSLQFCSQKLSFVNEYTVLENT
jgi:hypothetical protein